MILNLFVQPVSRPAEKPPSVGRAAVGLPQPDSRTRRYHLSGICIPGRHELKCQPATPGSLPFNCPTDSSLYLQLIKVVIAHWAHNKLQFKLNK